MKRKIKTQDLVYISLFAVLIAVCSWISIPFIVPFTMQTFAVFLALNFLGGKRGSIAILIYLGLGAVGVPVFSGFTSGVGVLFGLNGGYMFGWILAGILAWLFEILPGKRSVMRLISSILGLILCYAVGTAWFVFVYARQTGAIGIGSAVLWCVVPFILPDAVKLFLAHWLSGYLKKITARRQGV